MKKEIKILVVDDDQNARETMIDVIEARGYTTCRASTGEEAVEMVQNEKPDVVILDIVLPGISGFEACRRIKDIKGLKIEIIMLTGEVSAVDAAAVQASGADQFCVKTHDLQLLLNTIEEIVE